MVIILYLWYIQNGAPKLLLMAQPLKHPQSESDRHPASQPASQPRFRSKYRAYVYVARVKICTFRKHGV